MRAKQFRILFVALLLCVSTFGQHQEKPQWGYQFGSQTKATTSFIAVQTPSSWKYGSYGFDFDTAEAVHMMDKGMIATSSVYFSVSVAPGNYLVSICFGSEDTPSVNSVKAESKRLLVNQLELQKETHKVLEFVVHVQSKKIDSTEEVRLKPRDVNALNWDAKLSLEFLSGTAIESLKFIKLDSIPTLFLAGDSTVADQDLSPWASWGQFITQYFNGSIGVANYAASGASLPSFKGRKRWDKILSLIKKGDYVMIEFGHNDEKIKGKGAGPWASYTALLKAYVTAARSKGGIPILITPLQRRAFDDNGKLKPTHGDYPDAVRAVAKSLSVPLIDLTKMSSVLYESWGAKDSKYGFVHYPKNSFPGQDMELKDNTHFNDFGANEIALCVVQAIKDLDIDLKGHLKSIKEYNPKDPNRIEDWTLPMSPRFEVKKPEGN
ncbi:rhamnogalacturonan acetylesterase [Galbibacter sp.]|uniref:rhamnogalacturonan acetylesterase n=1 Tax=Galbibacter sp. TaxID=2918471 RepID=UPI003A92B739